MFLLPKQDVILGSAGCVTTYICLNAANCFDNKIECYSASDRISQHKNAAKCFDNKIGCYSLFCQCWDLLVVSQDVNQMQSWQCGCLLSLFPNQLLVDYNNIGVLPILVLQGQQNVAEYCNIVCSVFPTLVFQQYCRGCCILCG